MIRDRWLATATFAECDYAMVNGESARPLLEARTIYTIEDIPPGSDEDEGDAVEIGGYLFEPPTRRIGSGTQGEALPVGDDARDADEPQPALPAGRVSDALPPRQADAAGQDPAEIDAEGLKRASKGHQRHLRKTIAQALLEARPDGVSVKEIREACEREHGGSPSRTWVNDVLKEWREMSPPLVRHLGQRKGFAWVYGEDVDPDEDQDVTSTPETIDSDDKNDRVYPEPERPTLRLVREEDE